MNNFENDALSFVLDIAKNHILMNFDKNITYEITITRRRFHDSYQTV